MRAWTGSTTAGIVSGMLFAFNAHLLTRLAHLQALHVEFLPLALYALDQVLVRTRRLMPAALALAAAFVLQALCSNYTLVFLSAALLVGRDCAAAGVDAEHHRDRALALLAAGAIATVAVAPFLWPYYVVSRDQGLTRTVEEVALYSAGWLDYLTTGGRLHYAAWSSPFFDGRTPLFPGVLGFVLAVAALATTASSGRPARSHDGGHCASSALRSRSDPHCPATHGSMRTSRCFRAFARPHAVGLPAADGGRHPRRFRGRGLERREAV